jgi:hypothetical protein
MINFMNRLVFSIDKSIGRLRGFLTLEIFHSIENITLKLASIATFVAAIVGSLVAMVMAIKMDSLSIFLGSFAWILLLVIAFYWGSKARLICVTTLRNNPSSVASQELLDINVFVMMVLCLGSVLAGFYFSIKLSSLVMLLGGLAGGLFTLYLLWIALHPQLISVRVEGFSTAGIDAISYFVFSYKTFLRLSTVVFGLLPAIGAALLINTLVKAFGAPEDIIAGGLTGMIGFILVLSGLLAPWVIYLTFLFAYLLFDVLRSLLLLGRAAETGYSPGTASPLAGAAPFPEAVQVPVVARAAEAASLPSLSGKAWRNILIALFILVLGAAALIKGKDWYQDFQAKREIARVEEELKRADAERLAKQKAEEEQRLAELKRQDEERAAREAQQVADLMTKVRKHLGQSGLDLLLESDVHRALQVILKTEDNMRAFEAYYGQPDKVIESEGLVIATGCRRDNCPSLKAIFTIDAKTGEVGAVVNARDGLVYFGYTESNAPAAVKKWAISAR